MVIFKGLEIIEIIGSVLMRLYFHVSKMWEKVAFKD